MILGVCLALGLILGAAQAASTPIAGVTVTSDMGGGVQNVAKIVNGSGLTSYQTSATHAQADSINSWQSNRPTGTNVFNLNGYYLVDSLTLWNMTPYNGSWLQGFNKQADWADDWQKGVRDTVFEYSTDGKTYLPLAAFTFASNTASNATPQNKSFGQVTAYFIRMIIFSNYGDPTGSTGLCEIMFSGEPSPLATPTELIAYQGYLVDATRKPLGTDANGIAKPANVSIRFGIYPSTTSGSPVWMEQQTVTVDNGYFSVKLGAGDEVAGQPRPNLSTLFKDSSASGRFVGLSVDFGSTGAFTEILPRQQLLSVPSAFLANRAVEANSLVNPDGTPLITSELETVTITGNLNANLMNLDASKITSGLIPNARIEALNANKITSGTFDTARIPNLDASKITSGTFTGNGSGLTALNPASISAGTAGISITGNAATAGNFTGNLAGDVTGTQGGTVVTTVGGQTGTAVAAATVLANSATKDNTGGTLVKRSSNGNFTAGTITATLDGNAATATLATNALSADSVAAENLTGQLSSAQIASKAVTTGKLADGSVTLTKLADDVLERLPAPQQITDSSGQTTTVFAQTNLLVRGSVAPGADVDHPAPANHVAVIENTSTSKGASGLAIKLSRTSSTAVDHANNYVTFYKNPDAGLVDSTDIAGRIEGVSAADVNALKLELANYINPLSFFPSIGFNVDWPTFTVDLGFDKVKLPDPAKTPTFKFSLTSFENKIAGKTAEGVELGLQAYGMLSDPVAAAFQDSLIAMRGSGVTYESGSGDYAEWLERRDHDESMNFGDIVGVHGGKISKKTDGADQVMVISRKPIVLGNMPDAGLEKASEKVAFMGQVPVKILGAVHLGDYVLPSGRDDGTGVAVAKEKITAEQLGKVLGIAWGESELPQLKFIRVAVGLRPQEFARITAEHAKAQQGLIEQNARLQAEVSELKQQLATLATGAESRDARLAAMEKALTRVIANAGNTSRDAAEVKAVKEPVSTVPAHNGSSIREN